MRVASAWLATFIVMGIAYVVLYVVARIFGADIFRAWVIAMVGYVLFTVYRIGDRIAARSQ